MPFYAYPPGSQFPVPRSPKRMKPLPRIGSSSLSGFQRISTVRPASRPLFLLFAILCVSSCVKGYYPPAPLPLNSYSRPLGNATLKPRLYPRVREYQVLMRSALAENPCTLGPLTVSIQGGVWYCRQPCIKTTFTSQERARGCSIPFCCHIGTFQKVEGSCSLRSPESKRWPNRSDSSYYSPRTSVWNGKTRPLDRHR
jgi:hypothetical protein